MDPSFERRSCPSHVNDDGEGGASGWLLPCNLVRTWARRAGR